jgi:hypothetical protein
MKRAIAIVAALCLVHGSVAWAAPPAGELETGIRQVESGEFDAAVLTLDAAARKLAEQGTRPKDLARAYTYLAIAYLELGQEEAARAKVLEALRADKGLRLDPRQFPPKVVRFFEQVMASAPAAAAPTPERPTSAAAPARPGATPAGATPAAKPKSKALPIALGVAGAAGLAAVALGASGGGGDGTPPATVPSGPTLANLSATVGSSERSANLNCTQNVTATVRVTNQNSTSVTVTGIRHADRSVSGGCRPSDPFTFQPLAGSVGAGQTVTVLSGPLYRTGSGCCNGACNNAFCEIQAAFTVITSLGEIPAGAFNYGVTFSGCVQCASGAGADCARPGPLR